MNSHKDCHSDERERARLERIYGPSAAPRGWDPDVWVQMWRIAHRLSYAHLALAWLSDENTAASEIDLRPRAEADFQQSLRLMSSTSREELLDFFYEIGPERARLFVQRYSHLIDPARPSTSFL